MTRKLLLQTFIVQMILSIFFVHGYALEKETHRKINEYIANSTHAEINGFSLDSYLRDQLGMDGGIEESFRSKQVWKWLGEGGVKEDEPLLTGSFASRPANHFHNPLTNQGFSGVGGSGFPSGESAITWAQKPIGTQDPGGYYSWLDTRDYFYEALTSTSKTDRDQYYAKTFRGLGQLMHLVTDMSVPEHARDDGHYLGALPFLGSLLGHYEQYVLRHDEIISQYPAIYFDVSAIGETNPLAPVPIANLFDRNRYHIGIDPSVTLSSTIGLSEYTSANFLSPGTMFTSDFPYPRVEDCVLYTDEVNNRRYLKIDPNATNVEKVNHLAVVSRLYFWRKTYFPQYDSKLPLGLDPVCYQEYASYLIPRAVGYSAGLLDYFFRGKLEAEYVAGGLKITNQSEDTMHDGHFELYYDNAHGERKNISILSGAEVTSLVPGNHQTITFDRPSDFGEDRYHNYILVYRGGLGNETDAVAATTTPAFAWFEDWESETITSNHPWADIETIGVCCEGTSDAERISFQGSQVLRTEACHDYYDGGYCCSWPWVNLTVSPEQPINLASLSGLDADIYLASVEPDGLPDPGDCPETGEGWYYRFQAWVTLWWRAIGDSSWYASHYGVHCSNGCVPRNFHVVTGLSYLELQSKVGSYFKAKFDSLWPYYNHREPPWGDPNYELVAVDVYNHCSKSNTNPAIVPYTKMVVYFDNICLLPAKKE